MKNLNMNRLFNQGINLLFLLAVLLTGCKKDNSPSNVPGNNLGVGASANHLLSDQRFNSLTVDVMYMDDHEPTAQALDNLVDFLDTYLQKPGGISINQRAIGSGGQSEYSIADIRNIESINRQAYNTSSTIAISFIFLDGEYTGNSGDAKVLGVAYQNTSMAVFQQTVQENSGGLTQPSRTKLESTIIQHEVGHILGLVNNGTSMVENHIDSQHGHHCNNSNCLMYYAVETTDIVDNLVGSSIPVLDGNCQQDLTANGGK